MKEKESATDNSRLSLFLKRVLRVLNDKSKRKRTVFNSIKYDY